VDKLVQKVSRKVGQGTSKRRASLGIDPSRGQSPMALVITCCDSRVLFERLVESEPGELFVVRTVGNVVSEPDSGSAEEAALEYGLGVLGIRHVVVCGHSHCGAMSALARGGAGRDLPAVESWLRNAEAVRRKLDAGLCGPERVARAVEHNVLLQLERLELFPCVREALAAGALELHGWLYDIETASLSGYDANYGRFVELSELGRAS